MAFLNQNYLIFFGEANIHGDCRHWLVGVTWRPKVLQHKVQHAWPEIPARSLENSIEAKVQSTLKVSTIQNKCILKSREDLGD